MGRVTSNLNSSASFIADPSSITRMPGGRQIDWTLVGGEYQTTPGLAAVVVALSASALAAATSISFAALSGPIPSGTVLDFGTNKFARTTAAAAAAATSVAVAALPTALAGSESATFAGTAGTGSKVLPAGTPVGDALGSGKVAPRIVTTNPAIGLLETAAVENDVSAAISGVGIVIGGVVFENLLPAAWLSGTPKVLASAVKTELQTAGVGTGFAFQQYGDSR